MKKYTFVFIVSFLLFSNFVKAQVNQQDSLALVDLYNSTDGPNWFINYESYLNWDLTKSVYSWGGLEFKNGRVVKIKLIHEAAGFYNAKLKGILPSTIGNLTELTSLRIQGSFSGGIIPQSIEKLVALDTLRLSGGLTGEIPAFLGNLKELKSLELAYNQFAGEIPTSIGNLSSLKNLKLNNNQLTGEIPSSIGNLVKLESLNFSGNDFTGEIPSSIGNLKALEKLEIYETNLTGQIPESIGNLTNLTELRITENNFTGGIPSSIGNLTKLNRLIINDNNFSREIPSSIGNLNTLTYLDLASNNIGGLIPKELINLKSLKRLILANNNFFGDIPVELAKFPDLEFLILSNNKFNFANLEPLASADLSKIEYGQQEPLVLERAKVNGKTELEMKAGGEKTNYKWYYNMAEVAGANQSKYTVPLENDVLKYRCKATNSLLPYLTLTGIPPLEESKTCWQTGLLTFCIKNGDWENGNGTNKIKNSNSISINDFLFFDGTMTIDTSALEIEANGEFYVDNIPIPGGNTGKYTIAKGDYRLTLIGNEGKIMDFLNSDLSEAASLFGAQLSIDDLQFFSRQDTFGVKVCCSAHIPWVSESCGTPGIYTPGTDLKLKNFEITNKGIMSAGFEVENLGLFRKGHCLKRISYEYDLKKDIIIGGADIALPFLKVGLEGGYKYENGEIDSVAWGIEYLPGEKDKLKAIPIGFATLGVKGFRGHVSGLNQPGEFNPLILDIEMGGLFSDLTKDWIYKLEGNGNIIWPKVFKVKGKGQFLQPPIEGIPYQISGDADMWYDASENWLYMGFRGACGTMDEKLWLIDGVGNLNLHLYEEKPPTFTGNLDGILKLPKLSDQTPFSWLNSLANFPIEMKTENKFSDKNPNLIFGIALLKTATWGPGAVKYIIDVSKTWYQSGYFTLVDYGKNIKSAIIKNKSAILEVPVKEIFIVPENNEFGFIEINSPAEAPVSSLTSPSGKKYSISTPDDDILFTESEDKKQAFWSLLSAEAGEWEINLENPGSNDSIITFFQLKDKNFEFSMNQTEDIVTITWDISQVESGQTVNIMLDSDNDNFDGFKIKEEDATTGSLSFSLTDEFPGCRYYLYAQLVDEYQIIEAYAKDVIENPSSTLAPPENLSFQYIPASGEINFSWQPSPSEQITGYILTITDELGNDSVSAILNSSQTSISLFVEDFETKSAKIESFNEDWKIGCPTESLELTTGINEFLEFDEPENKLNVFPNPTTGNCIIRYFVSEDSKCEIRIFDIQGRQLAQPLAEYKSAGFHQLIYNYEHVPNGLYIIKFINNYQTYTIKSVLSK